MHTTVDGTWFRWTEYDLLDGVIVPAQGASVEEYDPWAGFHANRGKYRRVDQPYCQFLELHRKLGEAAAAQIRPSHLFPEAPTKGPQNDADYLILDWCNNHGLLGLLPVLSNSIRPPAMVEAGRLDINARAIKPGADWMRVVKVRQYFRDGGVWSTQSSIEEAGSVAAEQRLLKGAPKTGFTWFDWTLHRYAERPFDDLRNFFLPCAPGRLKEEHFQPPPPNSRQFWDCYGEPVHEFVRWCETFAEAATQISNWEVGGFLENDAAGRVRQAHSALSGLAQGAAPCFRFNLEQNTLEERRISAGLLASYALMFIWDRMDGRRALVCENCGGYFVTNDLRALYCSAKCRNTSQKRRSRAKPSVDGEKGRNETKTRK